MRKEEEEEEEAPRRVNQRIAFYLVDERAHRFHGIKEIAISLAAKLISIHVYLKF